ncbi:hypothetical protein J7E73_24515 [Paenibacillus albidus]|uniref:hypothetical protein n=1 Tax=Paenibacillus albidus TaxID=2041023 RepID=UPI001BE61763|nr:hypothetical protein [Paenibacillus albidus]MBT2292237.1 hypothetical protein [Paenibacillus albidus]
MKRKEEPALFLARQDRLVLLKVARTVDTGFDELTQQLHITAQDAAGEMVRLSLPYNSEWKKVFARLEKEQGASGTESFHALVRFEGNELQPVSYLRSVQLTSLKLDL